MNTEGEHYFWGQGCEGWHVLKSDELSVIRERMPPETSEVWHYHLHSQEVFYIPQGSAWLEAGTETRDLRAGDHSLLSPKTLHRISNPNSGVLEFLLISQPRVGDDRYEILEYRDEFKEQIKILNVEWLEKYFFVEPTDEIQLSNPQESILNKGGFIFYVRAGNEIVGTASLLRENDEVYELGKMAVTERAQGKYIGNALLEHCFRFARKQRVKKLILYSNTKLEAAIHLYQKFGFKEIPLEPGRYQRSNIKMEVTL